jgi:hypothetical protein
MRGRRFEKNRKRIRWNTLRIFSGRERLRCLQIVCRSRMALLGQAPRPGLFMNVVAKRLRPKPPLHPHPRRAGTRPFRGLLARRTAR